MTKSATTKSATVTLVDVAKKAGIDAKAARGKFRRLVDERPFDHTKVKQLNAKQAKDALDFLTTDFRVLADA